MPAGKTKSGEVLTKMLGKSSFSPNHPGWKNIMKIIQKQAPEVFYKEMFLEISQNSDENFLKKETLAQVLFCEFCEISMKTFFTAASHFLDNSTDPQL